MEPLIVTLIDPLQEPFKRTLVTKSHDPVAGGFPVLVLGWDGGLRASGFMLWVAPKST